MMLYICIKFHKKISKRVSELFRDLFFYIQDFQKGLNSVKKCNETDGLCSLHIV